MVWWALDSVVVEKGDAPWNARNVGVEGSLCGMFLLIGEAMLWGLSLLRAQPQHYFLVIH